MMHVIYSERLALFIHRITLAKRTREVQPVLFVRESSTQLFNVFAGYACKSIYDSVDLVLEVFCKGSEF